jgi:uncharacterized protein YkwD
MKTRNKISIGFGIACLVVAVLVLATKQSDSRLASSLKSKLSSISASQQIFKPIEEGSFLPEPLRFYGNSKSDSSAGSDLTEKSTDTTLGRSGVVKNTNAQRAAHGLPALAENSKLNQVASAKLKDLFAKQYFEHVSPSGVGPSDLAKQMGYEYIIVGENLALGNFKSDAALVDAWMASPGHRENILNPKFTQIGVAVGSGIYEGKDVWIAVQSFGTPLANCPAPDDSLKVSIATNQAVLKTMEQDLIERKVAIDSEQDQTLRNQKVQEYNTKVAIYNALSEKTKQQVQTYNAEVNSFNACING